MEGMADVSGKQESKRIAKAHAFLVLNQEVINLIKNKKVAKGDVLEDARVAGIMAAKKTHELIPLCHPLRISNAKIFFEFVDNGIKIISQVSAIERTGVEMEALVAVSTAGLTIYDMCKPYSKDMEIKDIYLLEKTGGKSGDYKRCQR